MRILLTTGPTREPIDAVRYIGNRSSGAMGAAIASAALAAGHQVTLICGPIQVAMPPVALRIEVETAQQMQDEVMGAFPNHDVLIMAAAVSDFRPSQPVGIKLPRGGQISLLLRPTTDILALAGQLKRPSQRTVGFSLLPLQDLDRSIEKLATKMCDLMVCNPLQTLSSAEVTATLLYPGMAPEPLATISKREFADLLIRRVDRLFSR